MLIEIHRIRTIGLVDHWENNTLHYVYELVQNGNAAFRENRMEEAINYYSRANNIKSGDPIILSNRSAAYIRISQYFMRRAPSSSECRPLSGLEPTTLGELALKDAEKLVELQSNSAKSYILKANALLLLEKYEKARDVILSGLQVDPFSNSLRALLQNLERVSSSSTGMSTHGQPERNDDFDCTLCLKLLYEPNFPEEYAERKQEQDGLINAGVDLLPLFVMDVVIPCQRFPLNIFEPRYRLMVRRIMEGNHRMGMAILDSSTGSLAEFACEVEITECEPLPDGRFYIEIESRRRFRIIRSGDQDGYRVAEVEWIQDVMPPEGTTERETLQELTYNAAESARSWIGRAKEAAGHDQRKLERLASVEVMMPSLKDPERFSFWLATLSNRRPAERLDLLRIRDTTEFHLYTFITETKGDMGDILLY
ncbi:unnamed protein product [Sphenostylis stenocarpa]|uniref:Lon N-terminal domain-containing protein n=1 Tax=Sphenostylis stenocarpa TaxID=92480 RepID=A0AA86VR61_9FABA|nr:unnamed protein product [Sphenostylis stenocarpa]